MKSLAKFVLSILWGYVMRVLSEEEIKALLKQEVEEWAEKHLRPAELGGEVKDFVKLLKDRIF
jgi:uncharacterized protein YqeY